MVKLAQGGTHKNRFTSRFHRSRHLHPNIVWNNFNRAREKAHEMNQNTNQWFLNYQLWFLRDFGTIWNSTSITVKWVKWNECG